MVVGLVAPATYSRVDVVGVDGQRGGPPTELLDAERRDVGSWPGQLRRSAGARQP